MNIRLDPQGPNAQQIKFWNEEAAPRWIRFYEDISAHIRPLGLRTIAGIPIPRPAKVLDIGCGCGDTTFHLAQELGPESTIVGVDISGPMLQEARIQGERRQLGHVRFEHMDAQTADLGESEYDAMISRFGVMFFSDPVAAFINIRRALKPDAPMAFVCWRSMKENPWLSMVVQALAKHIELPKPNPEAPGPFAFADGDRVRRMVIEAEFKEVVVEAADEMLLVAGRAMPLEETVDFLLQVGPGPGLLKEASEAVKEAVRASVKEAVAPKWSEEGLRLPAAAWIVRARA